METREKVQNDPERRYFESNINLEKREDGEESRKIEGYALVFEKLSRSLGWFREKIDKKALDNIDLSSDDIVALFNHDYNKILARTISETLTLKKDSKGLKYSFDSPNTTAGNDLLESVKRGDVRHSSFAFTVEDQKWEEDDEYGEIRTILKFKKIFDVSPVVNPAYIDTTVAKRSFEEIKTSKEDELAKLEEEKKAKEFEEKYISIEENQKRSKIYEECILQAHKPA